MNVCEKRLGDFGSHRAGPKLGGRPSKSECQGVIKRTRRGLVHTQQGHPTVGIGKRSDGLIEARREILLKIEMHALADTRSAETLDV
jgi:hypothetical protein